MTDDLLSPLALFLDFDLDLAPFICYPVELYFVIAIGYGSCLGSHLGVLNVEVNQGLSLSVYNWGSSLKLVLEWLLVELPWHWLGLLSSFVYCVKSKDKCKLTILCSCNWLWRFVWPCLTLIKLLIRVMLFVLIISVILNGNICSLLLYIEVKLLLLDLFVGVIKFTHLSLIV